MKLFRVYGTTTDGEMITKEYFANDISSASDCFYYDYVDGEEKPCKEDYIIEL